MSLELVGSCFMSLRLQAYTYTAAPSNTATPATTDATIGVTGTDEPLDGCCCSGSGKGGAEAWPGGDTLGGAGLADGASGGVDDGGIPADSIDLPLSKGVRETTGTVVCWT
jgi:hypothetical protein